MSQITAVILGSGGAGPITTLTGNSGGAVPPTAGNINVVGSGSITVTGNPGTSTLTISSSGSGITSITGDSGGAQAGPAITLTGGTSGAVFAGAANTLTMSFNNVNLPTTTTTVGQVTIGGAIFAHSLGTANAFVGNLAGSLSMTTASAVNNAGFGWGVLKNLTTGQNNFGGGTVSLQEVTSGSFNVGCGSESLDQLKTGNDNVAIGWQAGFNYTGSESDNILIGYNVQGTTGESNIMRIGTGTGGGSGQLNKAFISGIRGVTTDAADAIPVVISSTGQLGTSVIPAFAALQSSNIANVTGDGSAYTPIFDTVIQQSGSGYNNGTGTFTAPIAGFYSFTASISFSGIGAAHTSMVGAFNTSLASTFWGNIDQNPFPISNAGVLNITSAAIIYLPASATVSYIVAVAGGTKTVGIQGAAGDAVTFFSACRIG
jgi:hypothetical protein